MRKMAESETPPVPPTSDQAHPTMTRRHALKILATTAAALAAATKSKPSLHPTPPPEHHLPRHFLTISDETPFGIHVDADAIAAILAQRNLVVPQGAGLSITFDPTYKSERVPIPGSVPEPPSPFRQTSTSETPTQRPEASTTMYGRSIVYVGTYIHEEDPQDLHAFENLKKGLSLSVVAAASSQCTSDINTLIDFRQWYESALWPTPSPDHPTPTVHGLPSPKAQNLPLPVQMDTNPFLPLA